MLKMSDKSLQFLKRNCPYILEEDDLRTFLLKLDEFITMEGLDKHDNMTAFGHEAQAVYDEIYMCN